MYWFMTCGKQEGQSKQASQNSICSGWNCACEQLAGDNMAEMTSQADGEENAALPAEQAAAVGVSDRSLRLGSGNGAPRPECEAG